MSEGKSTPPVSAPQGRRWFQIHLLTAVMLMMTVGALIPIFLFVYEQLFSGGEEAVLPLGCG